MRHTDPRDRRRHRAPDVDHLAAAVRLDLSLQAMRAASEAGAGESRPDTEPPTGLIDLNAIRAALGQPLEAEPDPAAAAWLAGGPDPAAARMLERVDRITHPEPVLDVTFGELYDAGQAPSLPGVEVVHAVAADLLAIAGHDVELLPEEPADVSVPVVPQVSPVEGPQPVPVAPPVTPPAPPAPVFIPEHPRLTWGSRHDERSRAYRLRGRGASAPLTDTLWPVGPVGDQGEEGACVGWGIVDAVNARMAGDTDLTAADAAALYARAQQLDAVPGSDYSGTSVLAGLQAGVERGLFGGYLWCFGTRDIAQAVTQRGPVVVGVPWLSGMYDTGPGGLVQLTGDDTGAGHCLAIVGLLLRGPQGQPGPFFVWQNSWGASYGDGGIGYIHHRDLAELLRGVGEAALPTVEAQEARHV